MPLTEKLIKIIESSSEEIARNWCQEVRDSQYTPTLKTIPSERCYPIAMKVYRDLGYWLKDPEKHDLKSNYEKFGESLHRLGIRMEEVVMILVMVKRYLWLHLLERGVMATDLDVYQTLELNNRVVLYFDRAIYHSLTGYREAKRKEPRAATGD